MNKKIMLSTDLRQALFACFLIMVFIVYLAYLIEFDGSLNVDKIAESKVRFICSIQKELKPQLKYEHICGCSLIENIFAVTAAHCFMKYADIRQFSVVVQENDLNKIGNKTRYKIAKIVKHSLYEPFKGYDIALIKLQDEIVFDKSNFKKIKFANSIPSTQENLLLIGWADTLLGSRKVLKILRFNTIPASVCYKRLNIILTKSDICCISYEGRGALQGESGSPVVDAKQEYLVGLLSYGRSSFNSRDVFVFTAIKPFVKWIIEQKAYLLANNSYK